MRTTIKSRLLLLLAGAWALAAAPMAGLAGQAAGSAHAATGLAPDFALPTANGGSNVRLSEHLGEVVVLAFWSSGCGTCVSQLAALDELQETYRSAGLATFAVSVDDDLARAARFAAAHPARFPLLLDRSKSVSRAYGIVRLPTTVLIDRRGRVHAVLPEFRGTDNLNVAQLRALLDDPP